MFEEKTGYKVVHVVPKTGVDAVASYQPEVDKEFEARSSAASAKSDANRSIVWTMAPAAAGAAAAAAAASPTPTPGKSAAAPINESE